MFNYIPLEVREYKDNENNHTSNIPEDNSLEKYNFTEEQIVNYDIDENDCIQALLNLGSINNEDWGYYSF